MKKILCCLTILAMLSVAPLAVGGFEVNPDFPQPYAGRLTIAAPELLEGPEHSTAKTIQNGEISDTTQKLIDMGVIPQAADQKTQEQATSPTN